MNYPPPFQDAQVLAQHLCISVRTIEEWVKLGILPPPIQPTAGKRLWQWKVVEKHLERYAKDAAPLSDQVTAIREATRAAARHEQA